MAEIHITRTHSLGLAKARQLAEQWAEHAEREFNMECTIVEGTDSDVVEFNRPGVNGQLLVEAQRFELTAELGLLLGAFRKTIESEIEKNLDALLDANNAAKARKLKSNVKSADSKANEAKTAASKVSAKKPVKR